jgi:hypothetical protein
MQKIVFLYPHGGGGSWLNNLLYHLETGDRSLPTVDLVYDGQKKSTIPVLHPIGWGPGTEPDRPKYLLEDDYEHKIVFSSSCPFNVYLNYMKKLAFSANTYNMQQLPMIEQFFQLTNQARHWLDNPVFAETYYKHIDLDYSLIFQNPNKFLDCLFGILNSVEFEYTPDREYALVHLYHYRQTCPNPADYFANCGQIAWLGWCHAVCLINHWPINGIFADAVQIQDIANILEPHQSSCVEFTKTLMFEWTDL